ncbi:hypothetical protein DSO57_1038538 [Entomophthora muscae]|uniref:Uncharacterized protein n=1 Tax=Entomophthora muscae TaxID=34485 RepID=A0ACC2UJD3_9FUNG|nr:hypothetical protein DSO57_1038538 [Entomophthora muscae]
MHCHFCSPEQAQTGSSALNTLIPDPCPASALSANLNPEKIEEAKSHYRKTLVLYEPLVQKILPYLALLIVHLNSSQVYNQATTPSRDQPSDPHQALYRPPGVSFGPVHFTKYPPVGFLPPVTKCVLDCSQDQRRVVILYKGNGQNGLLFTLRRKIPLETFWYMAQGSRKNMDLPILGVLQQYLGLLVIVLTSHLSLGRLLLRLGLLPLKLDLDVGQLLILGPLCYLGCISPPKLLLIKCSKTSWQKLKDLGKTSKSLPKTLKRPVTFHQPPSYSVLFPTVPPSKWLSS